MLQSRATEQVTLTFNTTKNPSNSHFRKAYAEWQKTPTPKHLYQDTNKVRQLISLPQFHVRTTISATTGLEGSVFLSKAETPEM